MALYLPLEKKLASDINRRRIAEETRKQRIFNSKVRQIGIDVEALKWQCHNSNLKKTEELDHEKKLAECAINNDKLAQLFEEQKIKDERELNKRINEYRLNFQRPENQRDFDLYDPDQKKKEKPPRISDDDICPVSGLQKLKGEDLDFKIRKKKQQEQVRDLLLQQMEEKRLDNFKKDKEMYEWEKLQLDQDKYAIRVAKLEEENYRKTIKNLKNDNKVLALQNAERNMRQKILDDMEKRKDMEYNFYGPLLNEDLSFVRSSAGSNRIVPDRWKGMTKEQLEEIYQEQQRQIAEKQRKREEQQFENAAWNQQLMNLEKQAMQLEEKEKMHRQSLCKNLEIENRELSQERRLYNDYVNKVAFKNSISKDFFSQFNTTSR